MRTPDYFDSPQLCDWREQCFSCDRCAAMEQAPQQFFVCPQCGESLCDTHAEPVYSECWGKAICGDCGLRRMSVKPFCNYEHLGGCSDMLTHRADYWRGAALKRFGTKWAHWCECHAKEAAHNNPVAMNQPVVRSAKPQRQVVTGP